MKLFEFYKKLYEVKSPEPVGVCVEFEDYILRTRELERLRVRDKDTFCENCVGVDFYTESGLPEAQIFCECCKDEEEEEEETVEDEVVDDETDGVVTDEFRTTVNDGFSRFGCSFLFNVKQKNEKKLVELRTRGTNPEWQTILVNKINYVNGIITAQRCQEETVSTTTTRPTTIQTTEPTSQEIETLDTTETVDSIEQSFEQPGVIPEPLYQKQDDIVNIDTVQNDELINDLQIDLEKEIIRQLPEVQQRLKQFDIDAEKISYVIPLTLEAKNFMMELEMNGIKLPYLMLYYENTETLYDAMKGNNYVEFNKLQPLKNRVNYKEFWEWTKSLWENNNQWLKTRIKGTIPEFDKSTILP